MMIALNPPQAVNPALESARRRAFLRLIPLLFICYAVAYVDRTNVALAKLTMGKDLPGFDNAVFGFGAGVFFWGYFLLEVPGSVLVERWSARKWICRIMVTWGLVAAGTAFVRTPMQFYGMRFLLGLAEAGFFPGVIVYLTHWFTERDRAKALAWFLIASPVAQMLSPRLSAEVLRIGTTEEVSGVLVTHPLILGFAGWQWLYLLWGIPAVALGFFVLFRLPDRPQDASWLTAQEREALMQALEVERAHRAPGAVHTLWAGLSHPRVLLLCAVFFANVTANYGIEFFLPSILQDWYHLGFAELAWLVALPSVLVILGQLFVGWSSDRHQERRWHVLVPLILAAFALTLAPLTRGHLWLTVACFVVAGAGLKSYLPAFLALPNLFLASTAAAGSIGLINSIGNLGGWLGPTLLGVLQARSGSFSGGVCFLSGSIVIACLLLLSIPRRFFAQQSAPSITPAPAK